MRVSINAPGWGEVVSQLKLVYTSPAETRLLFSRRERDFSQLWSDLDPNYPLDGTSHYFYHGVLKPH